MLANATRICEAKFGTLYLREGDAFRTVAMHNAPSAFIEQRMRNPLVWPRPDVPLGMVASTKRLVHVANSKELQAYVDRDPFVLSATDLGGYRTIVCVPLLKENELVGAISIYRGDVRLFSDKQIELVQNFAAQAVIAIENTRLLNELRQSLEQQTATAEVLSVISSSPGNLEPIFQAMLEKAARVCDANFGVLELCEDGGFRMAALHNPPPAYSEARRRAPVMHPGPLSPPARVAATKQLLHVADLTQEAAYKEGDPAAVRFVEMAGVRTLLVVPMLKEKELIGEISVYRQEVLPFTDKQIALVQNFAAQAVIAIENTRLLNELRQSLEQQTATSEVLQVISSSPGELEPVFQTMLENATRICEANFGNLLLQDGGVFQVRAMHNAPPAWHELRQRNPSIHPGPNHPLARMAATKQFQHTIDLTVDVAYLERDPALIPIVDLAGARTALVVPMLKDEVLVGAIVIYRQEVRPFTDKQIALVQNFAAQAVIAIENTRLLGELREIPAAADRDRRRA